MDTDGYLYQYNTRLTDSKAEKLTDFTVSDFTVLDNIVYYVTKDRKDLRYLNNEERLFYIGC